MQLLSKWDNTLCFIEKPQKTNLIVVCYWVKIILWSFDNIILTSRVEFGFRTAFKSLSIKVKGLCLWIKLFSLTILGKLTVSLCLFFFSSCFSFLKSIGSSLESSNTKKKVKFYQVFKTKNSHKKLKSCTVPSRFISDCPSVSSPTKILNICIVSRPIAAT